MIMSPFPGLAGTGAPNSLVRDGRTGGGSFVRGSRFIFLYSVWLKMSIFPLRAVDNVSLMMFNNMRLYRGSTYYT